MFWDYIFDKRLRENYKNAASITSKEEMDVFIARLDERDRLKLLAYVDREVIIYRKKEGRPIKEEEYLLLHYKEYLSEEEQKRWDKADKNWHVVEAIMILAALLITFWIHK